MYRIIGGDRNEYGPVTTAEVCRWVSEGRLNGQSMAQADGGEWKPLSQFPEFAEELRAQAVPPLTAMPLPPVSTEVWKGQVLAREPQFEVAHCLSRSWDLLWSNFGLLFGATFLVWLIACLCQWNGITGLAYAVLKGVFYGGLYQVFLKRIRGQQSAVGETFSGFSQGFAQLLLAGAVSALLGLIATWCCFVIPGLYLLVAWIFCVPLVADKRLEFWSGMELSRKMVTKVWFQVFGLVLIAFSPYILMQGFTSLKIGMMVAAPLREVFSSGQPDISVLFQAIIRAEAQVFKTALPLLALTKLVLLLNLPFAVGALMYAYEDLFGARPTPAA